MRLHPLRPMLLCLVLLAASSHAMANESRQAPADDACPDTAAASTTERTDDSDRHRTTADPRSSIGRWRHDLSPELQQECEAALAPALEAFGYEPRPEGSLAEAIR